MNDHDIKALCWTIELRFPGVRTIVFPYSDEDDPTVRSVIRVVDVKEEDLCAVEDFAWRETEERFGELSPPFLVSAHGPATSEAIKARAPREFGVSQQFQQLVTDLSVQLTPQMEWSALISKCLLNRGALRAFTEVARRYLTADHVNPREVPHSRPLVESSTRTFSCPMSRSPSHQTTVVVASDRGGVGDRGSAFTQFVMFDTEEATAA